MIIWLGVMRVLSFFRRFFVKRVEFVEWDVYKERVDFIDSFFWQQSVRRQSVRNSKFF